MGLPWVSVRDGCLSRPVDQERPVVDWQPGPAEGTRGMSWVIGLVRDAFATTPGGIR